MVDSIVFSSIISVCISASNWIFIKIVSLYDVEYNIVLKIIVKYFFKNITQANLNLSKCFSFKDQLRLYKYI